MTTIIFWVFAVIAVVCAVNLVLQKHPIASALSLVGVMGSLAIIYLQLSGDFIAMAQLIVYAGAIMVLFLFVIMLLNAGEELPGMKAKHLKWIGAPLLIALLGLVTYFVQTQMTTPDTVKFGEKTGFGSAAAVGEALFQTYLLPFEVTSVLILIAILGAIVLARKEID